MTSSPLPHEWDRFVSNLKTSDADYLSSLREATIFSVQRSPQLPLVRRRVALHVITEYKQLVADVNLASRNSQSISKTAASDSDHTKYDSRDSAKSRDLLDVMTARRITSSTSISSIRLQLDAHLTDSIRSQLFVIHVLRTFLTAPYTVSSDTDPLFQTSTSLNTLKDASQILKNVPNLFEHDSPPAPPHDPKVHKNQHTSRKLANSRTRSTLHDVPEINSLLENLFINPQLLLEVMNLGKIPSNEFIFEKLPIPMFLKPPVLRMSMSIERLVVGMVNKEMLEPFYGTISLYYHCSAENGQEGLYRMSETQFFDMNNIFTLRYFNHTTEESSPGCSLYERLMNVTSAIERSRVVEFTIPFSSQICLSKIFLVVFLEKAIGVSLDESHAFYAKVRELEDTALADEKIRADVDRYSLHLQKLAEGVAEHDIRVISGVLSNKFHSGRYDSAINRVISSSLSNTLAEEDHGHTQSSISRLHLYNQSRLRREQRKGRADLMPSKFLGIDYINNNSSDEMKVSANVFAAYGKYGEQMQTECYKYLSKVKSAINKTGGLREPFAVSISPIFPLSAFVGHDGTSPKHPVQLQDQPTISTGQAMCPTLPFPTKPQDQSKKVDITDTNPAAATSHVHSLTNNVSVMGVPRVVTRSEESLSIHPVSSQQKNFTVTRDTQTSIQQLENFLLLAKVAYSKGSSILRKSSMEAAPNPLQREIDDEYAKLCDNHAFFNISEDASFERQELVARMLRHFTLQKESGGCSAAAFKQDNTTLITDGGSQTFIHPLRPIMRKINTFVRLPKNISQTEPLSTVLLNLYNERESKRRSLGYVQLFLNTSINTFGVYDSQTNIFRAIKDAPAYYTIQPDHLPDSTQETELLVWTYGLHLLKIKDYDEILLLLKYGYLTAASLHQILMFSLMESQGLSTQRIYLTLRDVEATLEHQRAFSFLHSRYFLDSIKGSKLHPKNIYVKQLDCFFKHEIGTPATAFKNRMYIYPQAITVVLPNVRCRTFFLKVEMRADDTLDNSDIIWAIYPRLHGAMSSGDIHNGRILFRSSYLTSTVANSRTARLHDEIKFELPLSITPKTHILFTLYGICDIAGKEKGQIEPGELSSIMGFDDTVFTPQEKTATGELDAMHCSSVYATNPLSDHLAGQLRTPVVRTAFSEQASALGSPASLRLVSPTTKTPGYNSNADKAHQPQQESSCLQHIVEAKSQLTLLGYAYLPIIKGVDQSGIPVLQNTVGVDMAPASPINNGEFVNSHDRSIMLSFQPQIFSGYLTSTTDRENIRQNASESGLKQPRQIGYMYCALRYESHFYTHFHFINAIYYAYSCGRSIVSQASLYVDESIKILRGFLENSALYAAGFRIKRDISTANQVNSMILDDQRTQLNSANQLTTPFFMNLNNISGQIQQSKRGISPFSGECTLLEHYNPLYNISISLASLLMHPKMAKEVSQGDLLINYSDNILSLFTSMTNESMAICNNLYQHCINEEIAAAFKTHKLLGTYNTWFIIARNFVYTPNLETLLAPLFGPASDTSYLQNDDFSALKDIYRTLHGIGNYISFSYQKNSSEMQPLGSFKMESLLLNNYALYMMIAHHACSLNTLQDLQNYVSYFSYNILRQDEQFSANSDFLVNTVPHNLLLIAKTFALILSHYKSIYPNSISYSTCNDTTNDTLSTPKTTPDMPVTTPMRSFSVSVDDSETMEFEADLISFINSILSLVEAILCSIMRASNPLTSNRLFTVTATVAKFVAFLILQSPKKSKFFSLLELLIERFTNHTEATDYKNWLVMFDFLHQLMKERTLLYSYSFTDIHASQSPFSKALPNDVMQPHRLISPSCIIPHLYIKALQYFVSVHVDADAPPQSNLAERYVTFRTVCISIFTTLWDTFLIDLARSTPSFLHIISIPLLLIILDSYNKFFTSLNSKCGSAEYSRDTTTHSTCNDGTKHVDSVLDFLQPTASDALPTPRTVVVDSDCITSSLPSTSRGASRVESMKIQHPDCSLEVLVTETVLFLIAFVRTMTDYHAKFLQCLTIIQAHNMLGLFSHVPYLFSVNHLLTRATMLTSTSYRIQSLRYLYSILTDKQSFSDNLFSSKGNISLKSAPHLFNPMLHDRPLQFRSKMSGNETLATLLNLPPNEHLSLGNLVLFSDALADVYTGKVLKHSNDSKQLRATLSNQLTTIQHSTSHDPYHRMDKHLHQPDFALSQLSYQTTSRQRQSILPSGVEPQHTGLAISHIPRKALKEPRDSASSRPGSRNTRQPASKLHMRQGSKFTIVSTLANATTSDDADDESIYRALEGSTDIPDAQQSAWKLTNSTVGASEDISKGIYLANDSKDSLVCPSQNGQHRKGMGPDQYVDNFSDGFSKMGESSEKCLSLFTGGSTCALDNIMDDLDSYLDAQIQTKSISILEACEIKFRQQLGVEEPSKAGLLLQKVSTQSVDPLYLKLVDSPGSMTTVVAWLLSTLVHEAAIHQLLTFAQYLVEHPESFTSPIKDESEDSRVGNEFSGDVVNVRADLVYTAAHFLSQDPTFTTYNEIILKALINYLPSLGPTLFEALENKNPQFDQGTSMLVKALLLQVDAKQTILRDLSATIIIMLLRMEFDHHINTFILFSKINCSLIALDLTDGKKKAIIRFFESVKRIVKEICFSEDARGYGTIGGASDDKSSMHEMSPISGKVSFICRHFYAAVSLFYERLLIVIESEYRIKQRSKIQSMGETIIDIDLYAELKLSQADCYVGQADLRLLSLQSLLSSLREHKRHIEAGVVSLLISGLISEYLVVKSNFTDKIIGYISVPSVYSVSKVLIPELRKLIPDITVQNDLDIWFSYLEKAKYLVGKDECMYSSLDGGQFIDLLTALQDAATEFGKVNFHTYVRNIYGILLLLSEKYSGYIRAGGDMFSYFLTRNLLSQYQKALIEEQHSQEHAPMVSAQVNYYWVSITYEVNDIQSHTEYIYCCPLTESIREFTERLHRFYDAPELRISGAGPKVSVQKVECYKPEPSAANITEKERKIKQRILTHLLSYELNPLDKDETSYRSTILQENYSTSHLIGVQTEPALHYSTQLNSHISIPTSGGAGKSVQMQMENSFSEPTGTGSSYYTDIIYNYYPFVLASEEYAGSDIAPKSQTLGSFISRQIFERRIQQQVDSDTANTSIKLSGCLCVYYFVAHPFPHTNSRQRIIYKYEEYSSPIQEAIRIIEKAIYDTKNLPHEVNKVFQNLVGMVTPSVNSGTMDIVRAFLQKTTESTEMEASAVQIVDFDDLVSCTTVEKGYEEDAQNGITSNKICNGKDEDSLIVQLASPTEQDRHISISNIFEEDDKNDMVDSPGFFQDAALNFHGQNRKSASSPIVEVVINQTVQENVTRNSVSNYLVDGYSGAQSASVETVSEDDGVMRTEASAALLEKPGSAHEPDDSSSLNSSDEWNDTMEDVVEVRRKPNMPFYFYFNHIIAPPSTPIEAYRETQEQTGAIMQSSVTTGSGSAQNQGSKRLVLCSGLSEIFLSISVYSKLLIKTDLSAKYYRHPYGHIDDRASYGPRQGSYLICDSTQCGSSQESRRQQVKRFKQGNTINADFKGQPASPYGTSRESGYHGRFNIAGFASDKRDIQNGISALSIDRLCKISCLRDELPASCKAPNSLSPEELEICQVRLGKLIVDLIDLQAHTFILAANLLRMERNYQGLYLQAREFFLNMLEELQDYVQFDKKKIIGIISQISV